LAPTTNGYKKVHRGRPCTRRSGWLAGADLQAFLQVAAAQCHKHFSRPNTGQSRLAIGRAAKLSERLIQDIVNTLLIAVDQILKESGCHPSFLQYFCSELIEVLARRNRKIVTPAEVTSVREKREYRDFVMKPFRSDTDFSLFERWLVLSLAGAKRFDFNAKEIMDSLGQKEPWLTSIEVDRALRSLELAGLVRADQRSADSSVSNSEVAYKWTIPAFVNMLEKTTDIERQTRELKAMFVLASGRKITEEIKK